MIEIGPNLRDALAMLSIAILVASICILTMLDYLKESEDKISVESREQ